MQVGVDLGSSPHTRGAPVALGIPASPVGIIPAYAGSTTSGATKAKSTPDHPRIRGEHRLPCAGGFRDGGSSPHTRGARRRGIRSRSLARIIPAYAGSTRVETGGGRRMSDHPRIRGEHDPSSGMSLQQMGSSPHTRGARRPDHDRDRPMGIIPAYAGSTDRYSRPSPSESDHPRIRGEHSMRWMGGMGLAGSSPHTRGALTPVSRCLGVLRIIPAYAGSTG